MNITRPMPVRFGTSLHPLTFKIAKLNEILEKNGVNLKQVTYQTKGSDKVILSAKTKGEVADLLKAMSNIASKPGSGLSQAQDVSNIFGLDGIGGVIIQVGPDDTNCGEFCGTKPPGQN